MSRREWFLTAFVVLGLLACIAVISGCQPVPPQGVDIVTGKTVVTNLPESDSGVRFVGGPGLPTDQRVYKINGTVVADVESVVRQVSPARGSVSGSMYGSYGYIGGTFSGEVLKGKTLVRVLVNSIKPDDTDWIAVDHGLKVVVVKMTDLKGLALYPGDQVDLTCRRQAEAVAAINQDEWFDPATYTTWELDYCRLTSPVLTLVITP